MHFDIINSFLKIGQTLEKLSRFKEALEIYKKVLKMFQEFQREKKSGLIEGSEEYWNYKLNLDTAASQEYQQALKHISSILVT